MTLAKSGNYKRKRGRRIGGLPFSGNTEKKRSAIRRSVLLHSLEKIRETIQSEYAYFLSERKGWSLLEGPQDLEWVAHAFRVLLHYGETHKHAADYLAMVDCQHSDGGWGRMSNDPDNAGWVSAFCGLMLIRGNRFLKEERIRTPVENTVRYFLQSQQADGRWIDPSWGDLDTTSHPVSFFNVVLTYREDFALDLIEKVRASWRKGMRFILDGQSEDGGWYDAHHPSGVETTAHLIQDALIADLLLGNEVGVEKACRLGMKRLMQWQSEEGSWDEDNVDHTMDCTCSLMVVSRVLGEERARPVIERGLHWILESKNPQGWGDFPGLKSNIERTCDGLDTLLKYLAFTEKDPRAIIRCWGYAV